MSKNYYELIAKAKSYYNSGAPELKNIKNGDKLFSLKWCQGLDSEINLWTYWQGAGKKSAEVMLLGQDFGTCYDEKNKDFYEYLCSSSEDNMTKSLKYIVRIKADPRNKTDNNLLALTKFIGEEYSASIPNNEKLFFTNMCLGYRTGEGISGGNVSYYLKHDSVYIKELISMIRPKVVICLGADTYFSLLSSVNNEGSYLERVNTNFWKMLDVGENYYDVKTKEFSYRIYGVSHAGSNGMINRKRLSSHKDDMTTGFVLMESDWARIGDFLRG